MSKRRHNFGTKRFKEKSLFIFHARIALKSLILLFVRLIARGARIGKKHTHTHTHTHTHRQTDRQTDRTSTVTLAHARRGLMKSTKVQTLGTICLKCMYCEQTGMKLSCIKPRQKQRYICRAWFQHRLH